MSELCRGELVEARLVEGPQHDPLVADFRPGFVPEGPGTSPFFAQQINNNQ